MNHQPSWERLVATARRRPDERDLSAPYGFAARVAARALSVKPVRVTLLDTFSLRLLLQALGVAGLLAVAITGVSYSALSAGLADRPSALPAVSVAAPSVSPAVPADAAAISPTPADDPVAELVNMAS